MKTGVFLFFRFLTSLFPKVAEGNCSSSQDISTGKRSSASILIAALNLTHLGDRLGLAGQSIFPFV